MNNRKTFSLHSRLTHPTHKEIDEHCRNVLLPVISNEHNAWPKPELRLSIKINHEQRRNSHPFSSRETQNNENDPQVQPIKITERKLISKCKATKQKHLIATAVQYRNPPQQLEPLKENQQQNDPQLITLKYKSIEHSRGLEETKLKESVTSILRIDKDTKKQSKVVFRDRTNSCRVAVKKSLFPFLEKQKGELKVQRFFGGMEQKLSTIGQQGETPSSNFISGDSYQQLIF